MDKTSISFCNFQLNGDRRRQGLVINDRPDALSPQVEEKLVKDLRVALLSAKPEAEAQAIRCEYLSKLPAGEIVARRLFASRDTKGAPVVTLSDQDGKPNLQLKVDEQGKASIEFLDTSGKSPDENGKVIQIFPNTAVGK